jgi:hypothetical protein
VTKITGGLTTEEGWNPKEHDDSDAGWNPKKYLDKTALDNMRRGTIIHELSHLLWTTEDWRLNRDGQYDSGEDVGERELNDAYWWQILYQSSSMQKDLGEALNYIVKDMLRNDYPNHDDMWFPLFRQPDI